MGELESGSIVHIRLGGAMNTIRNEMLFVPLYHPFCLPNFCNHSLFSRTSYQLYRFHYTKVKDQESLGQASLLT